MTNWIIIIKATVTTIQPAATPPIRDAEHDSQIGQISELSETWSICLDKYADHICR